jgi:hypothetical protein
VKRFIFIAVSLAANVALALALSQRPAVRSYFFPSAKSAAASSAASTRATPADLSAANAADRADSISWARLSAGDLPAVVAQLRAGGIPPRYLRVILEALVAERFADRHKAIVNAMTAKPWWQGLPYESITSDPKIAALGRQLSRDERALLYQLIGPEPPATDYDRAWAQRKYGDLTPDKIEQVSRINRDYTDLMAEIRAQAGGIILPEDRQRLSYIEQQRQADLAQVLTPDQLFEYGLRSSATANRLRDQLVAFDPSADEFRAIFQVRQAVEAQFGDGHIQNLTLDERRQRNDALNSLGDQIQAVLTPARFADYQLTTDPAYLQTNQFVASLDLPTTTTAQIVAVQKDMTGRMQAIVADRSLTADQRTAQLGTLAQEAATTLTAALGENGLAAYKQSVGNWLNNLERRAQPRPGAAVTPAP